MPKLRDFLPKDSPLLCIAPSTPIPIRKQLFLTTTWFLSRVRTKVVQEYAGETPSEILGYLTKRGFTGSDLEEITKGVPVDSSDSKAQFLLETRLPPHKVGDLILPKPRTLETVMPKKDIKVSWGMRVKRLREEAGLSQEKLSPQVFEETYNVVSMVEREKRIFTAEERDKFFKVLGKPVDEEIPIAPAGELRRKRSRAPKVLKPVKPTLKPDSRDASPQVVETPPYQAPEAPPVARVVVQAVTTGPVKQAILTDFQAMILNPNMTDTQASDVMSLFKSLAVTVLLR